MKDDVANICFVFIGLGFSLGLSRQGWGFGSVYIEENATRRYCSEEGEEVSAVIFVREQ